MLILNYYILPRHAACMGSAMSYIVHLAMGGGLINPSDIGLLIPGRPIQIRVLGGGGVCECGCMCTYMYVCVVCVCVGGVSVWVYIHVCVWCVCMCIYMGNKQRGLGPNIIYSACIIIGERERERQRDS